MKLNEDFMDVKNPDAVGSMRVRIVLLPTATHEQCMENVLFNSLLNVPWVDQIEIQSGTALVCGNGPSLKSMIPEIKDAVMRGGIVFACNSAAKVLRNAGIEVEYQVLMDGQPSVVDELADAESHLIASVCDPSVFCNVEKPLLWHPFIPDIENYVPAGKLYADIGGSYTVGNSAVCLAKTLGFKVIDIYGMDSSYHGRERYADGQYNSNELMVEVELNDKKYTTSYDLKMQVNAFLVLADELERMGCVLRVRGNGLLPDAFAARAPCQ